jgi:hypothetical protein
MPSLLADIIGRKPQLLESPSSSAITGALDAQGEVTVKIKDGT